MSVLRRGVRVLLLAVLVAGAAAVMEKAPGALAHLEAFRVAEIRLDGAHFLSLEELSPLLNLSGTASVWDDLGVWEARLRAHPLVLDVRVRRRFPGTLVLELKEREPVALLATPTLVPVDRSGRILPIDPARYPMDLPLVGARTGSRMRDLSPSERALVVEEVARISDANPGLASQLSAVVVESPRLFRARFWDPRVDLLLSPGASSHRLDEGLEVLGDALVRFGVEEVEAVDLRFEDQVVVRLRPPAGS